MTQQNAVLLTTNPIVPTRTGKTGKPGKMRNLFPVRKFSTDWKSREFYSKYWKNEGILPNILENLASFYFYFSLTL